MFFFGKHASSVVVRSFFFSYPFLKWHSFISVFCIFSVKIQGKSDGLSNVRVSLKFSVIEYDIELIFSMNDNKSLIFNLRSRKSLRHDSRPPFNYINEYHSDSNDWCYDLNVLSNLFDNYKSSRTSSQFKFSFTNIFT